MGTNYTAIILLSQYYTKNTKISMNIIETIVNSIICDQREKKVKSIYKFISNSINKR